MFLEQHQLQIELTLLCYKFKSLKRDGPGYKL